jgi:Ca2+-transporting ATPase
VHIALLHLVIDPACTVVFEALPAEPGLMGQPPRAPDAPLFGPAVWQRALVQGGLLTLAAGLMAFWPGLEAVERRSLVVALLLIGGGVLVWLNGTARSPIGRWSGAIGLALWLLLQAIPGLNALLLLSPPQGTAWILLPSILIALMLLGRIHVPKTAQGKAP